MIDYGDWDQFESICLQNDRRRDETTLPALDHESIDTSLYLSEAIESLGGPSILNEPESIPLIDEEVRSLLESHHFYNGIDFYIDFGPVSIVARGWHVAKNMLDECKKYRQEKLERHKKLDVMREKIKKRRASSYKQLKEALRTKRVVIPEGLIGPLKDMCHTALGEIPTHDSYKAIVAYMEALRPRDEERDEPASIDDQLDVYSDKIHRRDRDEQDSTDRS